MSESASGYRTVLTPAQAQDLGRTDPNVSVCEPVNHLDHIGGPADDDLGVGPLLARILAQRATEANTDAADDAADDADAASRDDTSGYGTDPPDPPGGRDDDGDLPMVAGGIVVNDGPAEVVVTQQQWEALLADAGLLDTFPPDPDLPARYGAGAVLCACLTVLRAEINLRWPGRDRTSDGWIGDLAHQRTKSDHNPNGRGRVDAIDVDVDGIDVPLLLALAIAHPSTNYVIYNGRIYSRSHAFAPRVYTGPNKHTKHAHVSAIQSAAAENDTRPWGVAIPGQRPPSPIESAPITPGSTARTEAIVKALPTLRRGAKGYDVGTVQALLLARGHFQAAGIDDDFGPATEAAVKALQTASRIDSDGVVGPNTWAALLRVA